MRWLPLGVLMGAACLHCAGPMASDVMSGEVAAALSPSLPPESAPAPPAGDACLDALSRSGAEFRMSPAERDPPGHPSCGMRDGVSISRGPTGIRYRPAIRVSCSLAL